MNATNKELTEFIRENDVKFIRLSFIDPDGCQKNLAVMSDTLDEILTNGMVFDGRAAGFDAADQGGNLKLYPDERTLHLMPWRGNVARLLCFVKDLDGNPVDGDARNVLKTAVEKLRLMGLTCNVGIDSEFYLFKTDEDGNPTKITQDNAGYFDIAPLDRGENVRREICLCLEEMGIKPLSSHHEKGPGQNEIKFKSTDAMSACDNQTIFKSVVKAIAARNGLFASFMPKPIAEESGNGLSLTFELFKDKKPLFSDKRICREAESFIAGVLNRAREMSIIFNPIPNSYQRLGDFNAPDRVDFSVGGERSKFAGFSYKRNSKIFIVRSADGAANIHLAVALILLAGAEGIARGERLKGFEGGYFPANIDESIAIAKGGEFLYSALGKEFTERYLEGRRKLSAEYARDNDKVDKTAFERL